MSGHHIPPDHDAGDERTLGGYMAVHGRPPAFEGVDGFSYSADIVVDMTGDDNAPWGSSLLFVRWGYGDPQASGHLETPFVVTGMSENSVREPLTRMSLLLVKASLDSLIRSAGSQDRKW